MPHPEDLKLEILNEQWLDALKDVEYVTHSWKSASSGRCSNCDQLTCWKCEVVKPIQSAARWVCRTCVRFLHISGTAETDIYPLFPENDDAMKYPSDAFYVAYHTSPGSL